MSGHPDDGRPFATANDDDAGWWQTRTPNVLFLFCHADDLEIACGGTAALIAQTVDQIAVVVATDEADEAVASQRRDEARAAAETLGIGRDRVWFLGVPDGYLRCDRDSVGRLRSLLQDHEFRPEIVFTHAEFDHHNDHRALAEIAHSALRDTCVCGSYVVNSLDRTRCRPQLFVDIGEVRERKRRALACHHSQIALGRVRLQDIDELEGAFARPRGLQSVEAFEVRDHAGIPAIRQFLSQFNACRFSRFWNESLTEGALCVVSERSSLPTASGYRPLPDTRAAVDRLRKRLERDLYGHLDITERCSDDREVLQLCQTGHLVIVGGPLTNSFTAARFNQYHGLRYIVDDDGSAQRPSHVLDRSTGNRWRPMLQTTCTGQREVVHDIGVLTVMPNPEADAAARERAAMLVGLMASQGLGLSGVCRTVTEDAWLREIVDAVPAPYRATGFQVLVDVSVDDVRINWMTLHGMRGDI
jgi:LmbE family N-acetylglucosaminyl deacetylase